ncbi:hypothetical protein FQN54_007202, partial [Arachnomyces sp. PD_36]
YILPPPPLPRSIVICISVANAFAYLYEPNFFPFVDTNMISEEHPGDAVDVSVFGTTFPIIMTMAAFMAVAFYNVIELHSLLFYTFKRYQGLYFWSVLVVIWGIMLNGLAVVLEFFGYAKNTAELMPVLAVLLIGWYMMATGQAVVLYSRLHLLVHDTKVLRAVLIMIIGTAIILHIPLTTVIFMVNNLPADHPVGKVYKVWEPLQLTCFSLQEMIISTLYIFRTVKMLRLNKGLRDTNVRKTFLRLIYMNVFIMMLDITLIALQYAGYDTLQHFYKPAVYSVKVKVEFAVLNQLIEVTKGQNTAAHQSSSFGNSYGNNQGRSGYIKATKDSKYSSSRNQGAGDTGYDAFMAADDNIPMYDVHHNGVMKTTEVAIERDDPGSTYTEGAKTTMGRSGSRSSPMSRSSSQVRLANSGS